MRYFARFAAAIAAAVLLMAGCGENPASSLSLTPKNPVNITIWHYYNGAQKMAFDRLVEDFNQTVGNKKGIHVQAHSQGSVPDLESSVLASFKRQVGSEEAPDIFSSYADTAYEVEQMGMLADLAQYFTPQELSAYVDSFLEEGRIRADDSLQIFPIAKTSEIFMMNKTAWEPFAKATGATLDRLSTVEGVVETARDYYNWTDSLTPDVPYDGKAFYGRDETANFFIISSMQLGTELFDVEKGEIELHLSAAVMRRIWDTYYVPYISGYFSSYGRYRSDDVKIGEIIAYTGSMPSSIYFPDAVETGSAVQPIDYVTLPAPKLKGGAPYAVQQGAGMVVTKSTPQRELACVTFLKWFTEKKNNMLFCATSGYMPVKKSAISTKLLDETIAEFDLDIADKTYDSLTTCFDTIEDDILYTNKAFCNGSAARNVLERNLREKAVSDRELVTQRLASGQTLDQAIDDLTTDEAFSTWYASFASELKRAAGVA